MGERIRGGSSLHNEYDPSKCSNRYCGPWRCVDCCKRKPDTDVVECAKCGMQREEACSFDDEYS